jgi:hypothetical protein
MSRLANGVAWLVHRWTHAYTSGLDKEDRDQRRAEIESDLWEHFEAARGDGENLASTGVQVLLRMVAGVPADVRWRVHAGAVSRRQFAVADGGTLDGWTERRRPTWINRHFWIVPLGLFLAVCAAMVWSSWSSRASTLSVSIETPSHLVASPSAWKVKAQLSSHIETYRWLYGGLTEFFVVENLSDRYATVRLDGFDELPSGFSYAYAQMRPKYAQMIAEADALVLAFERGEGSQAALETFTTQYRIHPVVMRAPLLLGGARIWSHSDELRVTCPVQGPEPVCSPVVVIPPGGSTDIGVRIVPKEGTETGLHAGFQLRMVEVAP